MKLLRRTLALLPALTAGLLALAAAFLLLVRTERTIEAGGDVRVQRYEVVRPEVGGIVAEVTVEAGEVVRRGQVLARLEAGEEREQRLAIERELTEATARRVKLDDELARLATEVHPLELDRKRIEQAQEGLAAAAAASRVAEQRFELETAVARLDRAERLAAEGLLSEQQLQETRLDRLKAEESFARSEIENRLARGMEAALQTELELRVAEQRLVREGLRAELAGLNDRLRSLRAQLRRLAKREAALSLTASLEGIVVGEPGRELLGRRVEPGEKLFTIVDPSSVYFVADVSEVGIIRVRAGQPARVEVYGLPRQRFDTFHGQVELVAPQPTLSPQGGSVVFPVSIRLDKPWAELEEGRFFLRGGMRGLAHISYRSDEPLAKSLFELLM